jgi:hypothetical protein
MKTTVDGKMKEVILSSVVCFVSRVLFSLDSNDVMERGLGYHNGALWTSSSIVKQNLDQGVAR